MISSDSVGVKVGIMYIRIKGKSNVIFQSNATLILIPLMRGIGYHLEILVSRHI